MSRTINLLKKILRRGLFWAFLRFLYEVKNYFNYLYFFNFFKLKHTKKNYFYAVYDLSYNCRSYNFLPFLLRVDQYCKDNNYNFFSVVIIDDNKNEILKDKHFENGYGKEKLRLRNYYLLPQILSLFENCNEYYFVQKKNLKKILAAEDIFHSDFFFNLKSNHSEYEFERSIKNGYSPKSFLESDYFKEIVKKWVDIHATNKRIITITIRNSVYDSARNTNIKEFINFAQKIDTKKYYVIFIPDTENLLNDNSFDNRLLRNEIGFAASFCLSLRYSLYKIAYTNIMVPNGPNTLVMYNDIPYIWFNKNLFGSLALGENKIPFYMDNSLSKQVHWSKKNQKIVYVEQTTENILEVFEEYSKNYEK
jgi:hypothetical protein